MIQRASRTLRRSMEGLTFLLDSTSLKLNVLSGARARFSGTVCGTGVSM
jgi:hypothetical protein